MNLTSVMAARSRYVAASGRADDRGIMSIKNIFRNAAIAVAVSLLAACAAPTSDTASGAAAPAIDVAGLLAAAEQSLGFERASYLLDAAALLVRQREFERAQELLGELARQQLPPPQQAHHVELSARLALERGEIDTALALLRRPDLLRSQTQLSGKRQVALGLLRARAQALAGDHLASVQQRIAIEPLLTAAQRERSRAQVWRSLMYLDAAQLQAYRDKALGRELRGWLELALIAKVNQGNLDLQVERLDEWSAQWRDHPGQQLPGDLRLLRQIAATQPQQVALLLPLSGQLGPFGQALRDGYMAALYDSRARGADTPTVRVYDTDGRDIRELYRQAVADGAEGVIGPLDKSRVAQLLEAPLPVPVLALNRVSADTANPLEVPRGLYQFSLAPEDEAVQLAELARAEGLGHALVIAPETNAQAREVEVFNDRWRELGGQIAAHAPYRDQQGLSAVIRSAFNIPQSQARAVELERLLGRNLEFSPRRRQDIDVVVMFANPAQARSIKPTLAYHFASDLPVYALSRSYAGYPQPEIDQDLDQVRFTEMPWILHEPPLKRIITTNIAQSGNFLRFYAMGIDSFYLQPRLQQLAALPESRVYGQTGALRLDERRVIRRELLLAAMKNGRPHEIASSLLRLDDAYTAMEGNNEERRERPARFD